MFIDSPVGTGFSYYDEPATVPNTTEDTTSDLIQFYKVFTESYTEFKAGEMSRGSIGKF